MVYKINRTYRVLKDESELYETKLQRLCRSEPAPNAVFKQINTDLILNCGLRYDQSGLLLKINTFYDYTEFTLKDCSEKLNIEESVLKKRFKRLIELGFGENKTRISIDPLTKEEKWEEVYVFYDYRFKEPQKKEKKIKTENAPRKRRKKILSLDTKETD